MHDASPTALSVCLSGIPWCTRCDLDEHNGDEIHCTTLEPSELVAVEVTQITHPEYGAEPLEFRFRLRDEPFLTAQEALQVAREIDAAVGSIPV